MLDVAAGNGNATLAAARRFAEVTSTDYVPALLESGRSRAAAEGASVHFQEADAENLPFPDGSFDVVLSTFGVMFTPDQEKAASELARGGTELLPAGRDGTAEGCAAYLAGPSASRVGSLGKTAGARSRCITCNP